MQLVSKNLLTHRKIIVVGIMNKKKNTRMLDMDKIEKTNGIGKSVAKFIFPFFQQTDLSVKEMSSRMGLNSHASLSMIRTGQTRLPIDQAASLSELIRCDGFQLGHVVMETCYRKEYVALRKLGLIVTKEERSILDAIMKDIPLGDFDEPMLKKIQAAIK